jgi:ribosomal protein S12 methylthiotransferase accessory factor
MEIRITFPGGKKVNAEYDGFTIRTDQSVKNGGEGSAPEPYMYFLSSIGTCAGIYLVGFCQSRNIPTDGISLVQKNEFVSPSPGKVRLGKVRLEITVPPDFPEKYLDALARVVDQCAVKKTILDPPEFEVHTSVR